MLDITITQATLGADVTVPGLDDDVKIHVDPGTASGTVVRVKGRVKSDDDSVSLSASELTLPDISDAPTGPVIISLPASPERNASCSSGSPS